jgi:hypothetical protein
MNNDGFNDIIVGNWTSDAGGSDAGRAFVYFTGADMDSAADIVFTGGEADLCLGLDVTTAGDMNGDGRDDLAIGAQGYGSERGRVFIYWGRPDLIGDVSPAEADVKLTGESGINNDWFGDPLELVDDVNRDGLTDLLIGAPNAGRAYLFFGDPTLAGVVPALNADIIFDTGGYFSSVSSGDFNGDGLPDFALANAFAQGVGGVDYAGAVYLFMGDSTFTGILGPEDADVVIVGTQEEQYFGIYLCLNGDINGDGYDDLVSSAFFRDTDFEDAGVVFVYHGRPSPPDSLIDTDADLAIEGESANDRFGHEDPVMGDTNGDGYDDLLVGSLWWPGYGTPDAGIGRVYLFRCGPSLTGTISASRANVIWEGEHLYQQFGRTRSWVPNVRAGSEGAFVFGAPSYSIPDSQKIDFGKVFVIDAGLPGTGADVAVSGAAQARLLPSRPNPFQDATLIRYELPTRQQVSLSIYDVAGRLVRPLQSGQRGPGITSVPWDRANATGHRVQSGIYFVRLKTDSDVAAQKVVIVD